MLWASPGILHLFIHYWFESNKKIIETFHLISVRRIFKQRWNNFIVVSTTVLLESMGFQTTKALSQYNSYSYWNNNRWHVNWFNSIFYSKHPLIQEINIEQSSCGFLDFHPKSEFLVLWGVLYNMRWFHRCTQQQHHFVQLSCHRRCAKLCICILLVLQLTYSIGLRAKQQRSIRALHVSLRQRFVLPLQIPLWSLSTCIKEFER